MQKLYITLIVTILAINSYAQGYEFALIHESDYNFKVVAIPDFTSAGDTDLSSAGFSVLLPAGNADAVNQVSELPGGTTWDVQQIDAVTLSDAGLGDGTKDLFLFNMPAGQNIFPHEAFDQIDLVSFEVSNAPMAGMLEILANNDPMAIGANGVFDSFFNSNIDNTSTQNYFVGIAIGFENFEFSTLSILEEQQYSFKLYPNPVSNWLNIESDNEIGTIVIMDSNGREVLKTFRQSPSAILNLSHIASGMYFIQLKYNSTAITKKLIIE